MRFLGVLTALIAALLPTAHQIAAQESAYKWEAGASAGISGYLGDYNMSNPFARPGLRASINGAYIYDSRWSFRMSAGYSGISGNSRGIGSKLPEGVPTEFKSSVGELTIRAEFNFFAYGEGETFKHLMRWTPYIAAGVGMAVASPHDYSTKATPLLPLALGVKFRLKPRLNLRGEFTMSKSFSDGIDGNADLYGIKSGWLKNTDWLSTLTIGITYEFGERCMTCHYYD